MEQMTLKQAFAPMKKNTTRVIVQGNTKKKRFVVEFDNKLIPEVFKEKGISFPK
jgi:hypothetical protein